MQLKLILEAALLAAGEPLSPERLESLFTEAERPGRAELRAALDALAQDLEARGIELVDAVMQHRRDAGESFEGLSVDALKKTKLGTQPPTCARPCNPPLRRIIRATNSKS